MKRCYFIVLGLLLNMMIFGQGATQAGKTTESGTSTGHRNFTTSNIYYGNNIIPHFKERGVDIFTAYPTFPHYVNTNNINVDVPNYRHAVYEWIKTQPEFIKQFHIDVNQLEKEEYKY